jgi:SAM-dependent methyltransferase
VGADVNTGMIGVARSLPAAQGASIEWMEHSASHLPFADGEFDRVLCAQTLQFVEDRPRTLAEMYRVLRPGGCVGVSLWCDIRESPYFDALVQAITNHVDVETATGLRAAFGLSDAKTIRALFAAAGFQDLRATVWQLELELPPLSEFVLRHVSATPMAAGFNAVSEEARQAVVQEMSGKLAAYETGAGVRLPYRTHLVQARK